MSSKISVSATGRAFSYSRALALSLVLSLGLSALGSPAVFADTVSAGPGVSGPAAGGAAADGAAASGGAAGTSTSEDPNKPSASEKRSRVSSGTYNLFKKGETISGVVRRGVDVAH